MKLWKTLVGLAVLALSVTRCELGTPPQATGGGGTEVEGIIVDQHGKPAAGIWVRVYPDSAKPLLKGSNANEAFLAIRDSAKTNANGAFSLPNLPSGTYNLVATLKRNDTTLALFRRSIVIVGNANLGTDTLRVAGNLLLGVAIQGSTVSGAQCYIPGSPYITLSDISGLCSLTGLPPGSYTVSVSLAGLPLGQSGSIAVISFQVTSAGIVNLTWVSLPPGVLPSADSVWTLTVDPIPTWFIGAASAGFKDSIAFTGLSRVHTVASFSAGNSSVGRNFNVGDGDFDPRGRTPQTLTVDLRFVNKDLVPWGGSGRVFDARGMLTHSDSAMPWKGLHRLTSKYRRAAIIVTLPDSLSSASIAGKVALKINRIVVKKNGVATLDSSRAERFANLTPHAFLLEYLNPRVTDSLEVLAYGEYSDSAQLLYKAVIKLTPNMTQAPELQFQWVGPTSPTTFQCLTAATLPPTLISPANGASNVATSPTVKWNTACGATSYRLQIATDSAFTQIVVNDTTADTVRNVTLATNQVYWWRVASRISGSWTGWSSFRRFSTVNSGTTAPAAPILLTPLQDTTIPSLTANFAWVGDTGATSYRVQIASDSAFISLTSESTVTNFTGFTTSLNAGTTYYWRVFAINANGSVSSLTRRFKTPTQSGSTAWTLRNSSTTNILYGLASRRDSLLVAVGNGGMIITSPDGNIWTARTSGIITRLSAVAWGNNQFVAVGDSGIVLTSPNGITWTKRSVPGGVGLIAVVRDSMNFIAVGNGGTIFHSPDGVTWQSSASGTTTGLYAIASSGSRVVVIGANGTILTSPAGATSVPNWTVRTSPTTNALYSVTWNGSVFLAAGAGGTLLSSPDGITWTQQSSGTSNILYTAASSNGTTKVAGGGGVVLTSANAVTWSTETTATSSILYALTKFRTLWVAVGNSGIVLTAP